MPDRLAEIVARLDAVTPWRYTFAGCSKADAEFMAGAAADIAYLLAEVEAWRNHCGCCDCQRLRGGEVIGCICEKCKRYKQEQADA